MERDLDSNITESLRTDKLLMLNFVKDAANAITTIHQNQVIHRDVKPVNFLVS